MKSRSVHRVIMKVAGLVAFLSGLIIRETHDGIDSEQDNVFYGWKHSADSSQYLRKMTSRDTFPRGDAATKRRGVKTDDHVSLYLEASNFRW